MSKLKIRLAAFNLLSKLVFTALFLAAMPFLIERINLRQTDKNLIQKREQVISMVSRTGIEPFIGADTVSSFGSYDILKEEYISIERMDSTENINSVEVSSRLIEGEEIEYRVLYYSFTIDGTMYLLEIGKSLESIRNTEHSTRSIMLIFLIFIVAITFFTDLEYTRRILRPLDQITHKLKDISSPSAFDRKKIETNITDFRSLDDALISLMERIQNLFDKEKEITVNISHELLTPVSVIRTKLESLLLREGLDHKTEQKLEESLKTLYRLQSLINSLLFIARIESHQFMKDDTVSIPAILSEIKEELSPLAKDAGISIRLNAEDTLKLGGVNRSLIFSMFYNIIYNGIKNTESGGEIRINGTTYGRSARVVISDSGKGMTEAQVKTIFSRFKADAGQNTEQDVRATGFGLAIVKTIADFHNISVSVRSESGKGTDFTFLFTSII